MKKFKVYFWKHLPKGYFNEIKNRHKDRLKDYMNVYICDTRDEMYDLTDKLEKNKVKRDYGARTWCYNKNYYDIETGEYVKTSPCCGHIVFTKEYYWMDSITHETSHAVIGYFDRKLQDCQKIFTKCDEIGNILEDEVDETEDLEELFCYMVGNIADQIVCKYEGDKSE